MASTTTDADLFVTVHLLDPSDAEVLWPTAFEPNGPVAQGWLRMSHRGTDDVRSLPHRPWHTHTVSQPLTPGVDYEANIEIWPMSIVAPADYRLGLSVRGQDYAHGLPGQQEIVCGRELLGSGAYWHEQPGERGHPRYSGRTTLSSSQGAHSYVLLPVIPS